MDSPSKAKIHAVFDGRYIWAGGLQLVPSTAAGRSPAANFPPSLKSETCNSVRYDVN